MQVILLERVGRLGAIGDEVAVKDGYARNFLLPQGKALRASDANRKRFEAEREAIEKRNAERRDAAAGIAAGLNGTSVVMIRQAGETGQLYGSVSSRDISDALAEKGYTVTKGQVELMQPIKTVGLHEVALGLHPEVEVSINVNVARSEDEAERQEKGEDLTVLSYDDDEDTPEESVAEGAEDAEAEGVEGETEAEELAEETERQEDA